MPPTTFAARQAYLKSIGQIKSGAEVTFVPPKQSVQHEEDTKQVVGIPNDFDVDKLFPERYSSGSITDSLTSEEVKEETLCIDTVDTTNVAIKEGPSHGSCTDSFSRDIDAVAAVSIVNGGDDKAPDSSREVLTTWDDTPNTSSGTSNSVRVDDDDDDDVQDVQAAIASPGSMISTSSTAHYETYGFKHLKKRADAILKIQRFWRVKRMLSHNKTFTSYASDTEAAIYSKSATAIQSQWRRYLACRNFNVLISVVRAHRNAVRDQLVKNASTRIQSIYRGYSTRRQHDIDEIVYRIVIVQSLVRRRLAMERRYTLESLNYLLLVSLVRKIQCAYRRYKRGSTITKRLLAQRRQNYGDYDNSTLSGLGDTDFSYVVVDTSEEFESKCCEASRCGLTDEVHEMLIESGKWFYDRIGDPLNMDTAENFITVMEMSEEASGCLCWKPSNDEARKIGGSSVMVIQS